MERSEAEAHLRKAMGHEDDEMDAHGGESLGAAEKSEGEEDEMDSVDALLGNHSKDAVHAAAKKGEHGSHPAHQHGSMGGGTETDCK